MVGSEVGAGRSHDEAKGPLAQLSMGAGRRTGPGRFALWFLEEPRPGSSPCFVASLSEAADDSAGTLHRKETAPWGVG